MVSAFFQNHFSFSICAINSNPLLNEPQLKNFNQYFSTPRSAKPWLGTGKFSFRSSPQAPVHSTIDAVFFGGNTAKCAGGGTSATKLTQARQLHQIVCEVLLESYDSLRVAFSEYLLLLPQWQQSQLGALSDLSHRLKKLGDAAKVRFYSRIGTTLDP